MIIYVTDVSKFSSEEFFFDHISKISKTNLEYLQLRFKGSKKSIKKKPYHKNIKINKIKKFKNNCE